MSEFTRLYDLRHLPAGVVELIATAEECAALAQRFALVAVKAFSASVRFETDGPKIMVKGRLRAEVVQSCAVSGEDLPALVNEKIDLRFVPARPPQSGEFELEADELDEIEYAGTQFDLGEALAQSLALGIDPFAEGPGADAARRAAGLLDETASGPFAALKGLLKD